MKEGDVYFHAWVDEGKVEIDEHVLRTIRGGHGFMTQRNSVTWGKRSTKNGDYGWLDPVPMLWRTKFSIERGVPAGHCRSKSAALRSALALERARRARNREDPECLAECDRDIAALERRLARIKAKAKAS
ncbi:MAG: hypothetical protein DI527_00550 [Chelatococcus sp.]|nr:MAG: hypothetical protein DI527_00550 [Chelatococcus sp.]